MKTNRIILSIQAFERKARITTTVQAAHSFTEADLVRIVGKTNIERTRAEKPGGLYKAWVFCQEGTSRPMAFTDPSHKEQRTIQWGPVAVQAAVDRLNNSVAPFYFRHNDDSSPRDKIGRVVGTEFRQVNGKASGVVVGWFPPDTRGIAANADTVSMEAIWVLDVYDDGTTDATGVEEISGLALGARGVDQPAFSGARELVQIAAMAETTQQEQRTTMDPKEITFQDVLKFVKDRNVHFSQLYTPDDIIGKPVKAADGGFVFEGGDRLVNAHIQQSIITEMANHHTAEMKKAEDKLKEYEDLRQERETLPPIDEVIKKQNLPDRIKDLAREKIKDYSGDPQAYVKALVEEDNRLREKYAASPDTSTPGPDSSDTTSPPDKEGKNLFVNEDEEAEYR